MSVTVGWSCRIGVVGVRLVFVFLFETNEVLSLMAVRGGRGWGDDGFGKERVESFDEEDG